MSNRVQIRRTKFVDLNRMAMSDGMVILSDALETENNAMFGYRIYDDLEQIYDNTLDGDVLMLPDAEFLAKVRDLAGGSVTDMLFFAMDHGMYVDDEWYDAEWVTQALGGAA